MTDATERPTAMNAPSLPPRNVTSLTRQYDNSEIDRYASIYSKAAGEFETKRAEVLKAKSAMIDDFDHAKEKLRRELASKLEEVEAAQEEAIAKFDKELGVIDLLMASSRAALSALRTVEHSNQPREV